MNEKEPIREKNKKLTEEEAMGLLISFLEQNGIKKDDVQIFASRYFESQKGGWWELNVMNPSGLFIVHPNGRVEDNYGVLNKK